MKFKTMISNTHNLNHIIHKKFEKEFLAGVNVSKLSNREVYKEMINRFNEFQTVRRPLTKLFKLNEVKPYDLVIGLQQSINGILDKFNDYEKILSYEYNLIELFVLTYSMKEIDNDLDIELIDMFIQELYLRYVSDINAFVDTYTYAVKTIQIEQALYKLQRFSRSGKVNVIKQFIEEQQIPIEYYQNTHPTHVDDYDCPARILFDDVDYRNGVIKFSSESLKMLLFKLSDGV